MNTAKLQSAIAAFVKNKKANAAYYEDNWAERNERKAYYQSFTKDKLKQIAMDEAQKQAEKTAQEIDVMKKSILARAFRGELGTNDPADEPAMELLKQVL